MPEQNDQILKDDYDKHIEAGLAYAGLDDDGEALYIGTDSQWRKYEQLINN